MRILFDHSVPAPLRRHIQTHSVEEARDRGWDRHSNGDLLAVAEAAWFEISLTADKNMRYQQNLKSRKIAIVELSTPRWPVVRLHIEKIILALDAAAPGNYAQVELPF